jgi:putative flavoprotein involved in K+ transport
MHGQAHSSRHEPDREAARAVHPADLIEAGSAFRSVSGATPAATSEASSLAPRPGAGTETEHHEVVVIGAGQAGLSVGYHLQRRGIDFVILDAAPRVGETWRRRWNSLRLFTPAKFDSLDGYRFPAEGDAFPTKDEMADYLEAYAQKFRLPLRLSTRVESLRRKGDRFVIETGSGRYLAHQVVVAAASYQAPRIPDFASALDTKTFQMHSHDYRTPVQLPAGPVLLVGAGNSGAEIAMDLAPARKVYLSGRDVGNVPFRIASFLGRKLLIRMVMRGLFHRVLTMRTPMGRKFRKKMHGHGMPLIRTRPGELEAAGVERVGRISGVRAGRLRTEDGRELDVASIIWCTGFHAGFDWIDLPVLDADGAPRHRFGKATDVDGLYFAGLHFQYAVSSTMIHGVGRDARRTAGWIAKNCAA